MNFVEEQQKDQHEEEMNMGQNVGMVDKIIRALVAVLIIVVYLMGSLPGIAGLLLIISGLLLSSVVSGDCPLYTKIGVNTNR